MQLIDYEKDTRKNTPYFTVTDSSFIEDMPDQMVPLTSDFGPTNSIYRHVPYGNDQYRKNEFSIDELVEAIRNISDNIMDIRYEGEKFR